MGYSAERGDTVSVVNSPFSAAAQDQLPPWKDPYYIGLAMQIGRYLLIFLAIMLIWRSVLKPLVQNLTAPRRSTPTPASAAAQAALHSQAEADHRASEINRYEQAEERSEGKTGVRTCRTGWEPAHKK